MDKEKLYNATLKTGEYERLASANMNMFLPSIASPTQGCTRKGQTQIFKKSKVSSPCKKSSNVISLRKPDKFTPKLIRFQAPGIPWLCNLTNIKTLFANNMGVLQINDGKYPTITQKDRKLIDKALMIKNNGTRGKSVVSRANMMLQNLTEDSSAGKKEVSISFSGGILSPLYQLRLLSGNKSSTHHDRNTGFEQAGNLSLEICRKPVVRRKQQTGSRNNAAKSLVMDATRSSLYLCPYITQYLRITPRSSFFEAKNDPRAQVRDRKKKELNRKKRSIMYRRDITKRKLEVVQFMPPQTPKRFADSIRVLFQARKHMQNSPVLVIRFEGVIGDYVRKYLWQKSEELYIRPHAYTSLFRLKQKFQIAILASLDPSQCAEVYGLLKRKRALPDAMYVKFDGQNLAFSYSQILADFGLAAEKDQQERLIVRPVLIQEQIVSSLKASASDICANRGEDLLRDRDSGGVLLCSDLPFIGTGDVLKALPVCLLVPDPKSQHNMQAISFVHLVNILETVAVMSLQSDEPNRGRASQASENDGRERKGYNSDVAGNLAMHIQRPRIEEMLKEATSSTNNNVSSLKGTNWSEGFSKVMRHKGVGLKFVVTEKLQEEMGRKQNLEEELKEKMRTYKVRAYKRNARMRNEIDTVAKEKVVGNKEAVLIQQLMQANCDIQKSIQQSRDIIFWTLLQTVCSFIQSIILGM